MKHGACTRLISWKGRIGNVWADVDTSHEGSSYLRPRTRVYCLLVGINVQSGAAECLILKAIEEGTVRVFERIALLEVPQASADRESVWIDSIPGEPEVLKLA